MKRRAFQTEEGGMRTHRVRAHTHTITHTEGKRGRREERIRRLVCVCRDVGEYKLHIGYVT